MSTARYLLFAGESYYPSGGWDDLAGSFDTIDDAKAVIAEQHRYEWCQPAGYTRPGWHYRGKFDWAHIVDTATGSVVASYYYALKVMDGQVYAAVEGDASHSPIWEEQL